MLATNLDKTLEELENDHWPDPGETTRLVTECHRLRRIPLAKFSIEDLRIMIGQGIGLQFLLPIAFEKLYGNFLVAGDLYEGDLLHNVVRVPAEFWNEHPELFDYFELNILGGIQDWKKVLEEMVPIAQSTADAVKRLWR